MEDIPGGISPLDGMEMWPDGGRMTGWVVEWRGEKMRCLGWAPGCERFGVVWW